MKYIFFMLIIMLPSSFTLSMHQNHSFYQLIRLFITIQGIPGESKPTQLKLDNLPINTTLSQCMSEIYSQHPALLPFNFNIFCSSRKKQLSMSDQNSPLTQLGFINRTARENQLLIGVGSLHISIDNAE